MKYNIRLDICTLCQLNCPACGMRLNNAEGVGLGYLTFDNFKKFIDRDGQYINNIEISSYGEPFLNPDVVKILEYGYRTGHKMQCKNGTNFNAMTDEKIRAVVDYQMTEIVISCDGVMQENYEKYRVNGKVDKVFDAIRKIQEYKKKVNSPYPKLIWQYVVRESSEPDIPLAVELAKELDVTLKFKRTWEKEYNPIDVDMVTRYTGFDLFTRDKNIAQKNDLSLVAGKCKQLWVYPAINWNGDLLGCCSNRHPYPVNVFEKGLLESLSDPSYMISKKYLLKELSDEEAKSSPCSRCFVHTQLFEKGGMTRDFLSRYIPEHLI